MAPHHQIKSSRRTLLIMDEDHPKSKWRIHQRKIFYSCLILLKYIFSGSLKVFLSRKQTLRDFKNLEFIFLSETSDRHIILNVDFLSIFKCMVHTVWLIDKLLVLHFEIYKSYYCLWFIPTCTTGTKIIICAETFLSIHVGVWVLHES